MRHTFESFPQEKKCPFCGTNEDKETILIPIDETEDDGLIECIAAHADCALELRYRGELGTFYHPRHIFLPYRKKESRND